MQHRYLSERIQASRKNRSENDTDILMSTLIHAVTNFVPSSGET